MLNSKSKVNIMIKVCAAKFGLRPRLTNVNARKIDGSGSKTYNITLARF